MAWRMKVVRGEVQLFGSGSWVIVCVDGKYAAMSWQDFRKVPILNLEKLEMEIINN